MDHHVHRHPGLGIAVMVRESWYKVRYRRLSPLGGVGECGRSSAGFEKRDAADVFCCEQIELRALLRPGLRHNQIVSASLRRSRFAKGTLLALNIMQNA